MSKVILSTRNPINLSEIYSLDNSAVLGVANSLVNSQELLSAIADKVMTKLLAKNQLINNLTTNQSGIGPLDASMGKRLNDSTVSSHARIDTLNNSIASSSSYLIVKDVKICYGGSVAGRVNFPITYRSHVRVTSNPVVDGNYKTVLGVKIYNVTLSGFTLILQYSDSGSVGLPSLETCGWISIGV